MIFYSPELDEIILYLGSQENGVKHDYQFMTHLTDSNILYELEWIFVGTI